MPWQKEGYLPWVLVEKNRIAEYEDFGKFKPDHFITQGYLNYHKKGKTISRKANRWLRLLLCLGWGGAAQMEI